MKLIEAFTQKFQVEWKLEHVYFLLKIFCESLGNSQSSNDENGRLLRPKVAQSFDTKVEVLIEVQMKLKRLPQFLLKISTGGGVQRVHGLNSHLCT